MRQRPPARARPRLSACASPSPFRLLSDAPASPTGPDFGLEPADADVGGRLFGRYRVVRAVGVGGFARVYHAVDPDLELDVAVKVLRPELTYDAEVVERFRREATTAAKLRHPHVITVLTVGRLTEPFDGIPAGAPYLVMDYLPHSLADRVSAGTTLPEADVARIGAEVARGLAYAHRQGIVHRDVKPENVLFARDGRAVVTDFGIARALSAAPSGPSRQVLLGTPAYFSPEQARGLPLDGRSDLYSLAVTLYRAATGVVPFGGDDWYVVMRQHVEETAASPSSINRDLSPAFDAVLTRALAKDPASRYPTGDALGDAFDALRGAPGNRLNTTEIPRVAAAPRAGVRARRLRWGAAAVAALGVAVVGGRVLAVRGAPERVPSGPGAPARTTPPPAIATPPAPAGTAPAPALDSARAPLAAVGTAFPSLDSSARSAARDSAALANASAARDAKLGRLPGARGAAPTHGAAAKPVGLIAVSTPAEANVYFDGDLVSRGPWRNASVPVGAYTVRASLGGLPGCASADTSVTVDVTPNSRHSIALDPVPCGQLMLEFTASTPPHYSLIPLRGGPTREGLLPLSQPLVLPDGTYRLTIEAAACAQYSDEHLPVVAGKTRRETGRLLCQ
ncbi:hypothetical protein tb265_37260 [Gemmatimonadetes bacterium T265]|nr:hypothetical protein tb265_37260 [Gemmatimonadetes bacterium T265]